MSKYEELAAPFPPEKVKFRVGSRNADKTRGMALAYIDARDVMDRLDEVMGPGYWQNQFKLLEDDKRVIAGIGLRIQMPPLEEYEWVWKYDGAGETAIEAEKGSISDAFKRAAVHWGIGRYLYNTESIWVTLIGQKRIDPAELPRLYASLPNGSEQVPSHAVEEEEVFEGQIEPNTGQFDSGVDFDQTPAPDWIDAADEALVSKDMLKGINAWPRLFKLNEKKYGKHDDEKKFQVADEILKHIGVGKMGNMKMKHWAEFQTVLAHYENTGSLP